MGEMMRTAKAGEKLHAKAATNLRKKFPRIFEAVTSTKEGCTIAPKSDAMGGQWVCADCGEVFQNNFGAHGHAKTHRRAWWTGARFEEP